MAAALAKVKRDLGREAVILSTRTLKQGGLMGIGARTMIEITASDQHEALPQRRRPSAARPAPRPAPKVVPQSEQPVTTARQNTHMQRELNDIRAMVETLIRRDGRDEMAAMPTTLRDAYMDLIQGEVAEELAAEMIRRIDTARTPGNSLDASYVREQLTRQMAGILRGSCEIEVGDVNGCKVVALVGPTGVGKTTTAAKLAAHFKLQENIKVGLVTIDTYRIAAVDQLKTYADIIDTPLEVVMSPAELPDALHRLSDCALVLIDTAGRSQFDAAKLADLKAFLDAAKPHETHLVLSGNSSRAVLMQAVERFGKLGIDRVIFTKLDEAVGIGTLLSVMQRINARLSYVTTGQDVPDDIEIGDGHVLARRIIESASAMTEAN